LIVTINIFDYLLVLHTATFVLKFF